LKEDEPAPAQDNKPFNGGQFDFISDNYQLAMLLGM